MIGEPLTKTYSPSSRLTRSAVVVTSVVTDAVSVVSSEPAVLVDSVACEDDEDGTVVTDDDTVPEVVVTVETEEEDADAEVVSLGVSVVVASSVLRSVVVVVSGTDIEIGGLVSASMTVTVFSAVVVTADGRVSSQSASLPFLHPESRRAAASNAAASTVNLFLFIKLQSFQI